MKQIFKEAFEIFLEGLTPAGWIAAFMMALVGIAFRLLIGSSKRDPYSERTPYKFSWTFLISDNAIRIYKSIAVSAIALFLSLRFAENFIGKTLGPKWTMFYALLIGMCLDFVVERWKQIRENFGNIFRTKKIDSDI